MSIKKLIFGLSVFFVLGAVVTAGCGPAAPAMDMPAETAEPSGPSPVTAPAWLNFKLTDVITGEVFTINDFKGKPVLLESFAVWCPTCLTQQKQIAELHEREGDAIIHISIDTDPNETAGKVIDHAERNGFDWYFAVSPAELTNALIDDFGLGVVIAPSAPVILINADQSARLLGSGVKSAADLLAEIEKGN